MRVAALPASAAAPRTPTTARASAAPAGARGLRVRDLDRDATAVELTAVELGDRVVRLLVGFHLHETEPARLSGEPVGDDRRGQDVTALGEVLAKPLTGGGVGKTADV